MFFLNKHSLDLIQADVKSDSTHGFKKLLIILKSLDLWMEFGEKPTFPECQFKSFSFFNFKLQSVFLSIKHVQKFNTLNLNCLCIAQPNAAAHNAPGQLQLHLIAFCSLQQSATFRPFISVGVSELTLSGLSLKWNIMGCIAFMRTAAVLNYWAARWEMASSRCWSK